MSPARLRLACTLAVAGLCLGYAAPAAADDASVRAAWASTKLRLAKQERAVTKAAAKLRDRKFERPKPLFRAIKRVLRTLRLTRARVLDEQASTPTGIEAKRMALRAIGDLKRAYELGRKGTRQLLRGSVRGFNSYRKAGKLEKRARRRARAARRLFDEAAKQPPVVPIPPYP